MKCRAVMLVPFVVVACGNSDGSGAGGTCAGNPDAGVAETNAEAGAGLTLPDCRGDWPAAWVAKEQQFVAAVNALRVAGGTCNGTAFPPAPALPTNPFLTQLSRCFARDQALAGANALVGAAADTALHDQVVASGFGGQLLGWAGDIPLASAEDILAAMLANSDQCPVLFDPGATTGAMGYVEDPARGVHRWAGVVAATGGTTAGTILPAWVSGPGVGRRVELAGVNLAGPDFGQNVPGVFGVDYIYPTTQECDYFVARGMNIFRFPFLWERLQRTLYGELDAVELGRLAQIVSYATGLGAMALLDPHNYARRDGAIIGSEALPDAAFADFWSKLATVFKGNPAVIFGLINEPNTLGPDGTERWLVSANAAIAAIRAVAANNLVLVPGDNWTGASSWTLTSNAKVMLGVSDPANHFAYEVHQYLDDDSSGWGRECVSATIGIERVAAFTTWARRAGVRGFLGEFGAPATNTCLYATDTLLGYLGDNSDVWLGWTWWAAGPWWGDHYLSIEPVNGADAPQMAVLKRHLTAP